MKYCNKCWPLWKSTQNGHLHVLNFHYLGWTSISIWNKLSKPSTFWHRKHSYCNNANIIKWSHCSQGHLVYLQLMIWILLTFTCYKYHIWVFILNESKLSVSHSKSVFRSPINDRRIIKQPNYFGGTEW